jgi:hypothetical protein
MTRGYQLGDGFRLEARFTVDGVLADPTTVVFQLKDPDDIITTYTYGVDAEVINPAVGVYYLDVIVSKPLTWWYRVVGTGVVIAAVESSFAGLQSEFV